MTGYEVIILNLVVTLNGIHAVDKFSNLFYSNFKYFLKHVKTRLVVDHH